MFDSDPAEGVMRFIREEDAVALIRLEYAEMPDLRLTFWQAQRLFNFSDDACERALSWLVRSGFLARLPDETYVRREA
jgi:hypothetical protein